MAQFTRFVFYSQYFRLMSSHHFVKEGQEPLLFVMAVQENSRKMLDQLLSWSPKLVVAEKAISELEQWSIKMDEVHVNKDHADSWGDSLSYQWPINVVGMVTDHFELSLDKLIKSEGHQDINILTDLSFDQLKNLLTDLIPYIDDSTIRVFGSDYEVFPVTKKCERFFPVMTHLKVYGEGEVRLSGVLADVVRSGEEAVTKKEGRLDLVPNGSYLWMARKLNFSF